MKVDLDPRGRKVVIFGGISDARQVLRRFLAGGATVTIVVDGPLPPQTDRVSTVRYATRPAADDTAGILRLIGPAWLVVTCGGVGPLRDRVAELVGHLHVLMIDEEPAADRGQVTLVGGGPGRTSLLTLEAVRALSRADVIFYDRLAPTTELAEIAPGTELVDVGKSPYHHPVGQKSIEEQMIMRARLGQSVVRLKGGDPFVFGRGGEEMQACVQAGVPVFVVPGISSAVAVPASAGIPVTHRGLSKAFTVISGHTPLEDHECDALVGLGGTIVILMGMANLNQIISGLGRAGLRGDTPAAVIERGFSDAERSLLTSLDALTGEVSRLDLCSPAVVIIGEVVTVAPQFAATVGERAGWEWRTPVPQSQAS
jgi:uroporphyrin-III C-methyltransferase